MEEKRAEGEPLSQYSGLPYAIITPAPEPLIPILAFWDRIKARKSRYKSLTPHIEVKMIGKPSAGKLQAGFDEGGLDSCLWTTLNGHEAGNGGYSQGLT